MPALLNLLLASLATAASPQDALLADLQQRYPDVIRWEIKPLAAAAPDEAQGTEVVLLGARSAVRVRNHVYWYSVAGFARVVSAVRAISLGEALGVRDGQLLEGNVVAANCRPLTDLQALTGRRAKKALSAQQIICLTALEEQPAVARGAEVVVHYVGGSVNLTTTGIAESDAAVGDALLVRNPRSRDHFRAVVSGTKEVTVHE